MAMIELDAIIASLRALGAKDLGATIAKKAAPLLQAAVLQTLAAGTSPEGIVWAEKKTGGRAYVHAASRLTSGAFGNVVRLTLSGPEVYGHFGANGMPVRQMLPEAGGAIPKIVTDAITDAARAVVSDLTL